MFQKVIPAVNVNHYIVIRCNFSFIPISLIRDTFHSRRASFRFWRNPRPQGRLFRSIDQWLNNVRTKVIVGRTQPGLCGELSYKFPSVPKRVCPICPSSFASVREPIGRYPLDLRIAISSILESNQIAHWELISNGENDQIFQRKYLFAIKAPSGI